MNCSTLSSALAPVEKALPYTRAIRPCSQCSAVPGRDWRKCSICPEVVICSGAGPCSGSTSCPNAVTARQIAAPAPTMVRDRGSCLCIVAPFAWMTWSAGRFRNGGRVTRLHRGEMGFRRPLSRPRLKLQEKSTGKINLRLLPVSAQEQVDPRSVRHALTRQDGCSDPLAMLCRAPGLPIFSPARTPP